MRVEMMNKRFRKEELIKEEMIPPELIGSKDYKTLIVCWGSNYDLVKEAVEKLNKSDVATLHYQQVYPLHPDTVDFLNAAERLIIIENNYTCQFGSLIQAQTCIQFDNRILKYTGMPFSVEEIVEKISTIIEEEK